MSRLQSLVLALSRIAVGWFFIYSGFSAFTDRTWQLANYLRPAHTFPEFYSILLQPGNVALVSLAIKILFIIVGILLLIGWLSRIASLLGIGLMLLFYFPLLAFPSVAGGFLIVDYHLLVALFLLVLWACRAGDHYGVGAIFRFSPF